MSERPASRAVRLARRPELDGDEDEAADELDVGGQSSFLLSASCCCAVASAFWSASSCCFARRHLNLRLVEARSVRRLLLCGRTALRPTASVASACARFAFAVSRSASAAAESSVASCCPTVTTSPTLTLHRGDGPARREVRRRRAGDAHVARRRHRRLNRPARDGDRALRAGRRRRAADEPVDGVQREDHHGDDPDDGDRRTTAFLRRGVSCSRRTIGSMLTPQYN